MIQYRDPTLAAVISLSVVGTVILSQLIGCMLPMAAKRLKLDPAVMAAPLITTIVDVASLMIYFSVATACFGI